MWCGELILRPLLLIPRCSKQRILRFLGVYHPGFHEILATEVTAMAGFLLHGGAFKMHNKLLNPNKPSLFQMFFMDVLTSFAPRLNYGLLFFGRFNWLKILRA